MADSMSDRGQPNAREAVEAFTWLKRREDILARYLALLAEVDSPLLRSGAEVQVQLASQLFAVVDDAVGTPTDRPTAQVSDSIGRTRAEARVHPAVSLDAARLIFVAALPVVTQHFLDRGDPLAPTTAAVNLNAAILTRMAQAATNYVDYLLDQVDEAHREEAMRLSRDLHDVIAPNLAVAVQSLDLAERYRERDSERAQDKLTLARRTLVDASMSLRAIAAEIRVTMEPGGLATTLSEYVSHLPPHINVKILSQGALHSLPARYEREVFLILREAIRNSLAHSAATEVSVNLSLVGVHFHGSVQDNGVGFDPDESAHRGTGLDSMHERAALLGAKLDVQPSLTGTSVSLVVPLPNRSTL